MASAFTDLHPLILREIDEAGRMIPFRRFMELALYHPDHGYYSSGRARVGKEGDFFTSISVGGIYGRLLASICREVWERLEEPEEFTIVEQGANDGTMAADILNAASNSGDDFSRAIHYVIAEPFAINRERQKAKLAEFPSGQVSWVEAAGDLSSFTGIHLSNELLDAFPVDSLRWQRGEWQEECVGRNGEEFGWISRQISDPALLETAQLFPMGLPEGFRVEASRSVRPWLKSVHHRMVRGMILTIDYGQAGEDRYAPHRADGTLLAYRSHRRFNDPLPEPGLRDITAQVDFSTLARQSRETGFDLLGYSDQHHFLVGAAEPWLHTLGDFTAQSDAARNDLRALQTLLNPASMGIQFKAIGLGKNFPNGHPLSCFKYQRPGIEAL